MGIFLLTTGVRAAEIHSLHGHVPKAIADLNLQPVGLLSGTNRLHLAIGLPLRNRESLDALLQQLYDPASPNYHQYLTPKQFTEKFGPTEQDYQAVVAFARTNGFAVAATYPNRVVLDVEGTVADVERTLHVTMLLFQHPTEARTFYAPVVEPSLDLPVPILHISGLDNYSLSRPRFKLKRPRSAPRPTPNTGSGPGNTYMGNDFRAAYVPGTSLTGSGQVVGLLEFDGYTPSDITDYETLAGLPSVTLSNVLLDGYDGVPTGSGGEVEVSLDVEMVISMAPGVSEVVLYEAGPYGNWYDVLNRMVTDNFAKQISCSWYIPGGPADPTVDMIFQEMAAQGQSFFNASGDSDAFVGEPDFPSESPYITQVGGTTLSTAGPSGAYVSETVWNWDIEYGMDYDGVGSSGGISTFYFIPFWQQGINMTNNQGSATMRNIPDVALTADNIYVLADGTNYDIGGTSCSAPLWAGLAALVNQQAAANGQPTVGFVNPALYAVGTGPGYASAFHDITTGNNTWSGSTNRFYAASGYDLCTGWGTPNGTNLINALLSKTAAPYVIVAGSVVTGGNGNGLIDPNECNQLNLIVQNTGSGTVATVNATLSTSTPGVTVTQPSSGYPNLTRGVIATNATPFQISTSPSFISGTPITLTLALTSSGGPNTLSYTLRTNPGGYVITESIGASLVPGTTDTGNHCDDCATTIALPFNCTFYGQTFSNATLSSNGNLQFLSGNSTYNFDPQSLSYICLPYGGFNFAIAPFWSDLRTDCAGGGIFTSVSGVAPNRIFNIEWRAKYYNPTCAGASANFEVRLYEGQSRFDVIYGTLNGTGSGATVGVQRDTGSAFSLFECNSGTLSPDLQLTFQFQPGPDGGGQCAGKLTPFQAWQIQYFGCTNCPPAEPSADPLGKGMSNTNQFLAGLNPTNASSVFRITSVARQDGTNTITWRTSGGDPNGRTAITNVVQGSVGTTSGGYSNNFIDVSGSLAITPSGDTITNFPDAGGTNKYYRIRLGP